MPWLWDKVYKPKSFFTFIRPNGQNPFPIKFHLTVTVSSKEPAVDQTLDRRDQLRWIARRDP